MPRKYLNSLRAWMRRGARDWRRPPACLHLESLEERILLAGDLPTSLARNQAFTIVGATGSPDSVLSVKIFDNSGNHVDSVQPFDNPTSLRVASGDFDGDGLADEFAVLGRLESSNAALHFRAEIVIYELDADGDASETDRFFAFAPGILGNGYITSGDFDGDGDDDLAVAQIGGGRETVTLQTHMSQADGAFQLGGSTQIDFGLVSAPRIGAGDTDNDGFDEIVVAARTDLGADVRVFDASNASLTPMHQGGFVWDFGIEGYARGAFVAVGEFDPTQAGAEIVLGSNVGGLGRVDIVSFNGLDAATLVENGRLTPFGPGYEAAVRVAVGQLDDRLVLVAGQDRFQDGQYTIMARPFDAGETNARFEKIAPVTALTDEDGLGPDTSGTGARTLGPFVTFANLTPPAIEPEPEPEPEIVTLVENSDFHVIHEQTIIVPATPSHLIFELLDLTFDEADDSLNDAFEAALLDSTGRPLVHAIGLNGDAYFNSTEGEGERFSAAADRVGNTIRVDLTHVPAGTAATLVLRLINNDSDTTTSATIGAIRLVAGSLGTPVGVAGLAAAAAATPDIDFAKLVDLSGAVQPDYHVTTFDEDTSTLTAELKLLNVASYDVDGPLLVAIDHISDPTVHVRGAHGFTPEGLPYVDLTSLLTAGTLAAGAESALGSIAFLNPDQVQFTFDVVVLGRLNGTAVFESTPGTEALVDLEYVYEAQATDPNGDPLTFTLAAGPDGMTIDPDTGVLRWTPAAADVGTHTIILRADDGRGGATQQSFTLEVLDNVPNRPPNFTSDPPVDASVAAFFEVVDVPTGGNPVGVALGDFTGLGINSLIAANQGDQTLSLLAGLGQNAFGAAIEIGVGEPPPELRRTFIEGLIVDLDFDIPTDTSNTVLGIASADFNGDGIMDIAAVLFSDNQGAPDQSELAILISNGDGSFQAPTKIPIANTPVVQIGNGILARDFDGDGVVDLLLAVPATNEVLFYKGDGAGNFAEAVTSDAGGPASRVQAADLNGDGVLDLAVNHEGAATIGILLGNGAGTFAAPDIYTVTDTALDVVLADVDGVNGLDLVINNSFRIGNSATEQIEVRLNDGAGNFDTLLITPYGTTTRVPVAFVADFDGDDLADVVAASGLEIVFYKGLGDGTFGAGVDVGDVTSHPSHFYTEKTTTDLNADGHADIVFGYNRGTNLITVGLGRGDGTFDYQEYVPSPGPFPDAPDPQGFGYAAVLPGDFNNDGVLDLAVGAQGGDGVSGGLSILLGATPGAFLAPQVYVYENGDGAVALADFNNDGIIDLAQSGASPNPIMYIRLGQGDGAFAAPTAAIGPIGGNSPDLMVTADFNQDGNADLAFANNAGGEILYAFGLGNGTFTVPQSISTTRLRAMVVADFNGDGRPDIAARAGEEPSSIQIKLFDPLTDMFVAVPDAGGLLSLSPTPGGSTSVASRAIVVGDFDGDTIPDLVAHAGAAGGQPERMFFFKGTGASVATDVADLFLAPVISDPAAGQLYALTAGDFNGDEELDVAGVIRIGAGEPRTAVMLGNGAGSFGPAVTYPAGSENIISADFTSDGALDLLVAEIGALRGLVELIGAGAGAFATPIPLAAPAPLARHLLAGDIDNDDSADFVSSGNSASASTYPSSIAYRSLKPGLTAVATGDFDGDGRLDILAANAANGHLKLLLGNGNNTFSRQHDILVGRGVVGVVTGDLNEDGVLDVVTANQFDDSISLLIGNGDGTFLRTDLAAGDKPVGIALGDLTGDELADIIVTNADGESITLFVNQGAGTLAAGVEIPVGAEPLRVAIGDVTGDDINDVVLTNPGSNRVTILPGFDDGAFDAAIFVDAGVKPTGLALGDLNQDGLNEIIVTNPDANVLSVLYGRGAGRFSRPQEIRVGGGPVDVVVKDVDGDGRLDLITANAAGDTVSVVYNRYDEDRLYIYEAAAVDPDGDPLTFTLVDGPGGMLLDAQTGEVTWAPTADQAGPNAVTLEVSDGQGGSATQSFVIHISGRLDNVAPLVTTEPATSVGVSQQYADTIRAVDGNGDQLHYTLVSGPDGMTVGDLDGQVAWDPRSNGLQFDGNDFMSIPDSPSLQPTNFTLETWVRFDANGLYSLISKSLGAGTSIRLDINTAGILFGRVGGFGSSFRIEASFVPELGQWYHLAFTYSDTQDMALCIDGVQVAAINRPAALLTYDSSPWLLGNQNTGSYDNLIGSMDEVRIWSQVRDETAIAADMHQALAGNETALVGYYRFDDADLLDVRDSSVNGNDGILGDGQNTDIAPERVPGVALAGSHPVAIRIDDRQGGVLEHSFTIDVLPEVGGDIQGTVFNADVADGALLFDGDDDFVQVLDSPTLHSDRAITISGWFKADNLIPSFQTIFFKGDSPNATGLSNREYALFLANEGNLYFSSTSVNNVGVTESVILSPAFVEVGQWYHFAAVVDSDAEIMRLYINGELLAYGAYDNSGIRTTTGPLLIGVDLTTSLRDFNGSLDELRIYNVARTEEEIQSDMLAGVVGDEPGLVAAWNFNEPSGITIFDLTSNGNDGILGGNGSPSDSPLRVMSDAPSSNQVLRDRVLFIDGNQNGIRDADDVFTTSDSFGRYVLPNLLPGAYDLIMEGQQGWLPVTPVDGIATVTVIGGQATVADFTLTQVGAPLAQQGPTITSMAPTTIEAKLLYTYNPVVDHPDGRPVVFDLSVAPDGMAVDPVTGEVAWRPNALQAGEHRVLLRVTDDRGLVFIEDFTLEVTPGNTAPVITSTPGGPAVADRAYRYQARAQDAEDESLNYTFEQAPAGMAIDPATGRIDWTPTIGQVGFHDVTILVVDGRGGEARQTFTLEVLASAANLDPVINSTPRTEVRLGNSYYYQIDAFDPDPDPLTYELVSAPAGMTIDADGLIVWTPTPAQFGPNLVQIRVTDGLGGEATQDFAVDVKSQAANQAPAFVSSPITAAAVDELFAHNFDAFDPDGDPLEFFLEEGPVGMSLDAVLGTLRWLPDVGQVGAHEVIVRVMDPAGAEATQQFTIHARGAGANAPPTVVSVPPTETAVGQTYLYSVDASDPEGDSLTFALLDGPTDMTIDANTGAIAWTPDVGDVGVHPIVVRVTDARGAFTGQAFEVVVLAGARNRAPVITTLPPLEASVGDTYSYTIEADDPEGLAITYDLINGPAGMTVDSVTGEVSWTPAAGDIGLVAVTFAAFDPDGAAGVQTFELLVLPANNPPLITSTAPTSIAAGAQYRYDVLAADPDAEPLEFTLLTAPAGATIDAFGRLRWTTSTADLGTHDFEIEVRDRRGAVDLQSFQLEVQPDTTGPLVSVIPHRGIIDVGQDLLVSVSATDNVGVATLDLFFDGTPVPLDEQGRAVIPNAPPGGGSFFNFHLLTAVATDQAGNIGEGSVTVNFRNQFADPGTSNAPTLAITSPAENGAVFGPSDIIGTVDDDNLTGYRLLYRRADQSDNQFVEFASGTTTVVNGVLGRFDPTLLENDSYVIRLEATDATGGQVFIDHNIGVSGALKLGNFQLSFVDLAIPVSGIPITLARTYDTLRSDREDDFGFGWRMEFRNADLRTSLPKSGLEDIGIFAAFKPGTRVYVTLPGGQRQGFTFTPTIRVLPGFGTNLVVATPRFTPDAGVTSRLSVHSASLIVNEFGELYSGGGQPYNPAALEFGGGYTLTTQEGIAYRLDGLTGNMTSATDRNGNQLTFDDAGVHSSTGKEIAIERDARGRISAVIDPMGNRIEYTYSASGDLATVTDREDNTTTFAYNPTRAHYLDEVIDPLGRTGVRNEYDANGRLIQTFDGEQGFVELSHDPDNLVETAVDAAGNVHIFEVDARGNVVREVDALGNVIQRSYDLQNRLISETDPLGNTEFFGYDSRGHQIIHTYADGASRRLTRDGFGLITAVIDPLGNNTRYLRDARGNLVQQIDPLGNSQSFGYDVKGNLLSHVDARGNASSFQYDQLGNRTLTVDALGQQTSFTFDANGNALTTSYTVTVAGTPEVVTSRSEYDRNDRAIRVIDGAGSATSIQYDPAGNRTAVIDAFGNVTRKTYDANGNPTGTILADGAMTSIDYDVVGNALSQTTENGRKTPAAYDAVGRTVALGNFDDTPNDPLDNPRKQYEYDDAGNVVAAIDELGNRTEFEYDSRGNQILIRDALGNTTQYDYDAARRRVATIDALGRVTRFIYDSAGRLTGTIFADGTRSTTTYDAGGNVAATTNQAGHTDYFEYDVLNRLTAVVDSLGNRTEYEYDETGNLILYRDAEGLETTFEYDRLGRQVAVILPLGQRSSAVYDALGRLLSQTSFNGDVITFDYDTRHRRTAAHYPDGSSVVYVYGDNGGYEQIIDSRGTTSFSFDENNRLLQRTEPDGQTIAYTYNDAGDVTSITTLAGTVLYTYDELRRLETVTGPEGDVTTYSYDGVGNLVETEYPNDTRTSFEYNLVNHIVLVEHSDDVGVFLSFRYTLDALSNRIAVEEASGRRVEYSYDEESRLLGEEIFLGTQSLREIIYTYDANGNRLSRDDSAEGLTIYTYDFNGRLVTEVGANLMTTYSHDDNGNLVHKLVEQLDGTDVAEVGYEWDFEKRLIGVDDDGDGLIDVENVYDAEGDRVAQIVDGVETRFLLDKSGPYSQVAVEYTSAFAVSAYYIHGLDLISQTRGTETSYYHIDGLGSTRALTNAAGAVTDAYVYDAYGRLIGQTGTTENWYLFAGEQRDPNTGLDYLRARHLDVNTGVFVSRDTYHATLTEPITWNRHLYVHSNPVNLIDPSGNTTATEVLTTIALINSSIAATLFIVSAAATLTNGGRFWEGELTFGSAGTTALLGGAGALEVSTRDGDNIVSGTWFSVGIGISPEIKWLDHVQGFFKPGALKASGIELAASTGSVDAVSPSLFGVEHAFTGPGVLASAAAIALVPSIAFGLAAKALELLAPGYDGDERQSMEDWQGFGGYGLTAFTSGVGFGGSLGRGLGFDLGFSIFTTWSFRPFALDYEEAPSSPVS